MKIKDLIKQRRYELGENQEQFGRRYKTTANTISRWESGQYQVPNWVIESFFEKKETTVFCPTCMGKGKIVRLII